MTKVEYETNIAIACSCICFVKVIVKLLNINLHKATAIISFGRWILSSSFTSVGRKKNVFVKRKLFKAWLLIIYP